MRMALLACGLVIAGCTTDTNPAGGARTQVQRDVESYAIASCLTQQTEPYLKDQGDAWASVVVQRMHGDIEVLAGIAEQVQRENTKGANGDMAVMRDETRPRQGKPLPVLHCGEVIDRPAVRAAIQKAIAALRPFYESR
ncbi:hypothetical protein BI380_07220 [Delftia tsuruhatensis]|uniref:Lipoprotein n=2 Tax=Delftia tsuruhatensis TaxID=180282 RepID=A0ABN4SFH2_9BURK|nr:hypothetical protein BI380_07220 [Delftia tsuruhatensis]